MCEQGLARPSIELVLGARYPQFLRVLSEIFGLHFHLFDNNVLVKVASIGESLVAHFAAVLHHISS